LNFCIHISLKFVELLSFFTYYDTMTFINRLIQAKIQGILSRGKSVLLLGPRQTGKTTLLAHQIKADITYSFVEADLRRRYETNPENLVAEIKAYRQLNKDTPLPIIIIDEIQKVPVIMDSIQDAIDQNLAIFVLTGSSARKLKHQKANQNVNLLPGRVIELHMDALSLPEIPPSLANIEDLILNGSLPEVIQQENTLYKEELLTSYVSLYLEEEVRAEALVRNLASFSQFLSYAAVEAGNETNISRISQEIGIPRQIISEYYQILLDCLVVNRVEPVTSCTSRRRLSKSPKYLFFDMGVRRVAAGEGLRLPQKYYDSLFEQFIGIELLKLIRLYAPQAKLKYWHDHKGPEVDFVIELNRQFIPIEVKWTENPSSKDARHLIKFMGEHDCIQPALVVCRTPKPIELNENILAISWIDMPKTIKDLLSP
jgi:uncharacterized protein